MMCLYQKMKRDSVCVLNYIDGRTNAVYDDHRDAPLSYDSHFEDFKASNIVWEFPKEVRRQSGCYNH
jgi:hypothetical protein